MKGIRFRWAPVLCCALAVPILLAAAGGVGAQDASNADPVGQDDPDVKGTVNETVEVRQQTQQKLDDWSADKAALLARYRAARSGVEWLSGRKTEEEAVAGALAGRVSELQRRLAEADRLEGSIQDTLQVILERLEESVQTGLPFLPEERRLRLATVRQEMTQPDVTAAEKLRRVLEALQVEAGYGSTVEVYQDLIEVEGQQLHVDILRLGRLSLFWRTPDGKRAGHHDRAARAWVELPGQHRQRIERAMEMASRMRQVELIDLPLGRIAP